MKASHFLSPPGAPAAAPGPFRPVLGGNRLRWFSPIPLPAEAGRPATILPFPNRDQPVPPVAVPSLNRFSDEIGRLRQAELWETVAFGMFALCGLGGILISIGRALAIN